MDINVWYSYCRKRKIIEIDDKVDKIITIFDEGNAFVTGQWSEQQK